MCSALDLGTQGKESGCPVIAFSATEVIPTASSTQTEKDAWLLDPLTTVLPSPRPRPFVERSKSSVSLGEQDKPDVIHIHDRGNQGGVSIYGTALMVSESAGIEQKPHDGDNQVTVLVDSGA